jgi:BASS family bile acid:Na+ symporter
MFGLGMSLTFTDFARVAKYPKPIIIALICQMFFLPFCAFLIAVLFKLQPDYAVGLMIIASAPGGSSATLLSHLFKGDVALNISLTAVNSVLALFTMPLIVKFAVLFFFSSAADIAMPLDKIAQVFTFVLAPAIAGMAVKRFLPAVALKTEKPIKIGSVAIVILLVGFITYSLSQKLPSYNDLPMIVLAALTFNIVSLLCGYYVPVFLGVNHKQSIAIAMEIGIHNTTLSLFIAFTAMQMPTMAILPAVYGVIMFFTTIGFGYLVRKETA